ncbi:hypothetical protein KY334_04420 [Candidatus Woesearchaeota archaeon]|nr:hypothetical protein [Candidatus Woesearchaeota archaeon]
MGIFKNIISKEFTEKIKISFGKIENELNEHLEDINANTHEIQSIYELLNDLDAKIDKLDSRLDKLQIRLDKNEKKIIDVRIQPLTTKEKDVFFALYTNPTDDMTYKQISQKIKMDEVLVQEYVTYLIAKGIPISKKFQGSSIFISLDKNFKELQAKENIIKKN